MTSIDRKMKEFLNKCGCSEYTKYFLGIKKVELLAYSPRKIKLIVKSRLSVSALNNDQVGSGIDKIVNALIADSLADSGFDNDDPPQEREIKQEFKQEKETNGQTDQEQSHSASPNQDAEDLDNANLFGSIEPNTSGSNHNARDSEMILGSKEDENEIIFIEQKQGDVSIVDVKLKQEDPELVINIDDDDEGGSVPDNTVQDPGQCDTATDLPAPRSGQRRAEKRHAQSTKKSSTTEVIIVLKPVPSCAEKLRSGIGHVQLYRSHNSVPSYQKWNSHLINYGELITVLDCLTWTWSLPGPNQSEFNLAHVLSNTPNLEKLNILANCLNDCEYTPEASNTRTLPKLHHLKIRHECDMKYQKALRQIIISANNLSKTELEYKDEHMLRIFLSTLKGLDEASLRSIKHLSIKELDNDSVALVGLELNIVSQIQAKNLTELFLGFSLWHDCKEPLEAILHNFSKLESLTIEGCFITTDANEPKIVVDFPVMGNLKYLSMGKNYKFSSIIESIHVRPKKRRRTSIRIRNEDSEQSTTALRVTNTDDEDLTEGEFFTVTLKFPPLGNLESLLLGAQYEIQDLHFSYFPSLKVFGVSSAWNLVVKFPKLGSRHPFYGKVTSMQFPDSLEDETFVTQVVTHFPNIEEVWIDLPTVKVLRAFSKAMLSLDELKLRKLLLKVQFDFESLLDWAILEKPSIDRENGVTQSVEELEKIRVLKLYKNWEEYVKMHQIQIPKSDDLFVLEDETKFKGLGSLFQKLKSTLDLKIDHIPRTLRLPKGNRHWNDKNCEFTNVLIGFDKYEYPFSKEAWEVVPILTLIDYFLLPPKAIPTPVPKKLAFFQVDTTKTVTAAKKDDQVNDLDQQIGGMSPSILCPNLVPLPWYP